MIKAVAVIAMLAIAGSSVSEFSLTPEESFTLHFENDYVFAMEKCGATCITLRITQQVKGTSTWTGQLFDLQEHRSYPLNMEFEDVTFDSVYVVSTDKTTVLRVSYRESTPVRNQERLVKAGSEKETGGKTSFFIVCEVGAVIFLIFFAAHRLTHKKKENVQEEKADRGPQIPRVPYPAVGFHDGQQGIPRQGEDPDLELLQQLKELEDLKELEMMRRTRRRLDEDENLGLDWI